LNRHVAEARGRRAETLAAWWLRLHGWRILARRARIAGGEVDLVAKRGRTVAFVEVKQRRSERLAPRYARPGDDIRIDAIFLVPGQLPRHLVNVWCG
jgi:putative endonuclease